MGVSGGGGPSVQDNGRWGLNVLSGEVQVQFPGTRVSGNGFSGNAGGIQVIGGAVNLFRGVEVDDNIGPGVLLLGGASAIMGAFGAGNVPVSIDGNSNHGIEIRDTSTAHFFNGTAINSNGGFGIFCEAGPPAVAQFSGTTPTFGTVALPNTLGDENCP